MKMVARRGGAREVWPLKYGGQRHAAIRQSHQLDMES